MSQPDQQAREAALHAEAQAGERAKLIFEDELVQGSLAKIKQTIMEQWADLSIENKAQAEELKRLLWAAKQFEAIFTVTIAGGQFAKNELLADNAQIRAEAARGRLHAA